MRPIKPAAGDHDQIASGQGTPDVDLQADREDVPHDDAEADGEVDAAGHHRQRRGQRQQRDDRLVGEDRAEVELGRKGVGQQEREEDDQEDRQDRQAVDRQQADDRLASATGRRAPSGSARARST